MTTAVIRVLLVDAATAQRADIVRALELEGDLTVIGQCDGAAALDAVRTLRPDVVALTSTPNGATTATVETIMAFAPTPIVVLRSPDDLTPALERRDLEAGAVGVVPWPIAGDGDRLRSKVRLLQRVAVVRHPRARLRPDRPKRVSPPPSPSRGRWVGMAASTGGPHTLVEVVRKLAGITVPVLIVQHIHPEFFDGFVDWLGRAAGVKAVVAEDGEVPQPGVFHLAPSALHLKVTADRRLALDPKPESLHRPSANELFRSMAESLGSSAVGVLLTGMGDDGATGLLAIHRAGGTTIVQDGASSAIDGMPRAARELGAAGLVASLDAIPGAVLAAVESRR